MRTAAEWKAYYATEEFRKKFLYDGKDLGVTCTEEGTSFLLWSPAADSVTLNLYRSGDTGDSFREIPMSPRDHGVWEWRTGEGLHGVYYDFTLKMDGETR